MKKLLFDTLFGIDDITDLVEDRIYQRYTLGGGRHPDKPKKPFLVVGAMPSFPVRGAHETSAAEEEFLQVYFYDKRGSYVRINSMLDIVRANVHVVLEGTLSASGRRCMESRWQGASQDYDDEEYDAFVRHCTFRMVGSTAQM